MSTEDEHPDNEQRGDASSGVIQGRPEMEAPTAQGRMPSTHGPLTEDLISPEDASPVSETASPDEMDAYGNGLNHEGIWHQKPADTLSVEDVADTHDWGNAGPNPDQPQHAWINEKEPE